MLLNVPSILNGDILKTLCDMGHGDSLAIVDANYPAMTMGKRVIQVPGSTATDMLKAVMMYFPLDHIMENPALLMAVEKKDRESFGGMGPEIFSRFDAIIHQASGKFTSQISRQDFYDMSRDSYCILQTGEERLYGDIIIYKGPVVS